MSNYPLPPDYEERVYAGVLGKLIGVYLGRPFEQWSHEAISKKWGEIRQYVHADLGVPLIVTDDDITGTFTFLRALEDHQAGAATTAKQIGQTWLNYIAEGKHILWWGGVGMSTEHTAFLRMKAGIDAPRSGSAALNGRAVAEEIGAQIFVDGWALVSPGQPEQAARLATEASLVSHDGEAVHGAVVIAVMESLAFVESDIDKLIDSALAFIPKDCEIAELIADVRAWHTTVGDWRVSLGRLKAKWGYERYGTNCPMVSNHGVIILALLYGEGDFDRSMMIVNTCGYDTDCNAGNLGCLLGIRNGLAALSAGTDWRTPVNDRMYLPAADGHRGINDAASMALEIANWGREIAGESRRQPKSGSRYHFDLPGATHGFSPSELCPRELKLRPVSGGLEISILAPGTRTDAEVATFVPPEALEMKGYGLTATPTLYSGQTVTVEGTGGGRNREPLTVRPFVRVYNAERTLQLVEGPQQTVLPGAKFELSWVVPDVGSLPIAKVGISLAGRDSDRIELDRMDWRGMPELLIKRPEHGHQHSLAGQVWQSTFVGQIDHFSGGDVVPFDLIQNQGQGLLHTGGSDWRDYAVSAEITPWLTDEFGLVARVQGLTRYYGLLLGEDGEGSKCLRLIRMKHERTVLAERPWAWEPRERVLMTLSVHGSRIVASVGEGRVFDLEDDALTYGGIGFAVSNGRIQAGPLRVGATDGV